MNAPGRARTLRVSADRPYPPRGSAGSTRTAARGGFLLPGEFQRALSAGRLRDLEDEADLRENLQRLALTQTEQ